jgi:DNA repair protein RecN (Recombination protein N)
VLLKANGFDAEANDILLRRAVTADGRSRAYVNDSPVGIQLAREIGSLLLEIHGQTDDRGLFDVATHRLLLDAFGGHTLLAEEVVRCHAALVATTGRLASLRRAQAAAAEEIEYLEYAAKELRDLAPEPGEEEPLATTRGLLTNAGRLAQEISAAADFVGGDASAEVQLAAALRRLSRLPAEGRSAVSAAETALDSALTLVQEARSTLEVLLRQLENDPGRLEIVEDRLFALRAAARKYNVPVDSLGRLRDEFEAKLASLDVSGTAITAATVEVERLRADYRARARELSACRAAAAKNLEEAVSAEFSPLKLGAARFRVAFAPLDEGTAGASGFERIAFEIATIEGASFGPLAKIASGGELARFALALKVSLAAVSPPAVLVFDEVDRGVGGAVAAAVGERLQRLAQTTQVLLVTHSPQVAARATRHFRIARQKDATRVSELDIEERVEEIARMLSGAAVSDEARAAARRLVAESQAQSKPKKRVRA